ncbi:MAG: glycosyltransferase family 4 protein [Verrucomicrobiota bacterium]
MIIVFVTYGKFEVNATLKRATGMAHPLIREGYRVILLLQDDPVNRLRVAHECPDAETIWHQHFKSAFEERKAKQVAVNRLKPDIIWICGPGMRNWVTRPTQGCILLSDYSERYANLGEGSFIRRIWEYVFEWIYPVAFDGHVCASRYLQSFFRRKLKFYGKSIPPLYLPYAYTSNSGRAVEPAHLEFPVLEKGKKVFLYLGSFWENYGFWDMLEAFRQLRDIRDDFVFLMLGKGPELEPGREWIEHHGLSESISIVGFVPDAKLDSYLRAADAFLCPLRETLQDLARCPSKLFLYIPFRKPIITCRIGEAAELLGSGAAYYQPRNIPDMVERLVEVCEGRSTVESTANPDLHSWDQRAKIFTNWLKAYFFND